MELKIKNKKINVNMKEVLILLVPVLIMILLIPVLPDKIPMQFGADGSVNWYLDKRLSFLIGLLPYVVYKSYRIKHRNDNR